MDIGRRGKELKAIRNEMGLTDIDVCHVAKVSISSLYKIYRGEVVRPNTRSRVEEAFSLLRDRLKATA